MSRDTPARRTYGPAYSAEELAILRKHYPELGGARTAELLPGRSAHSVNKKAEKLGLRYQWPAGAIRPAMARWTPSEVKALRVLSSGTFRMTREQIAQRLPGRTFLAVREKMRELDMRMGSADLCFVCDERESGEALVCEHWICRAVLDVIQARGRRSRTDPSPYQVSEAKKRFQQLRRYDLSAGVCEILIHLIREEIKHGETATGSAQHRRTA